MINSIAEHAVRRLEVGHRGCDLEECIVVFGSSLLSLFSGCHKLSNFTLSCGFAILFLS